MFEVLKISDKTKKYRNLVYFIANSLSLEKNFNKIIPILDALVEISPSSQVALACQAWFEVFTNFRYFEKPELAKSAVTVAGRADKQSFTEYQLFQIKHRQNILYNILLNHSNDPFLAQMKEQGILTLGDFIPSMGGRGWLGVPVSIPQSPYQKLEAEQQGIFRQVCG